MNAESFRYWLETAQHSRTNWNEIGCDVTRLAAIEHVRNKYSSLSQALYTAVVINLIKLIDIVNIALNYCTELLKRWICMISTQIINKNSTFKVDYNRDIDSGECSFCSVVVPSQYGSVHWDNT